MPMGLKLNRLKNRMRTAIEVIILLAGLLLIVLASLVTNDTLCNLMGKVGTGLIAAAVTSMLVRAFMSERPVDTAQIVCQKRIEFDHEYIRLKKSARLLDVVSVSLSGALRELAEDRSNHMLRRVVSHRTKVRLAFLSPLAPCVDQRALEDGTSSKELRASLRQSIRHAVQVFKKLQALHKQELARRGFDRSEAGSLEIVLIDFCPHITIFRADDTIIWGPYLSHQTGLDSPALKTLEGVQLFSDLTSHFDALWVKRVSGKVDDSWLVRYQEPFAPRLNEQLVEQILDET